MAELRLPSGHIALVDDEDLERVRQLRWHVHTDKRKTTNYAIAWRYELGQRVEKIWLHRFVLGYGKGDKVIIDHRSCDGLDCRKANLREATHRQNMVNRRWRYDRHEGEGARYRGVCLDGKKFRAQIGKGKSGKSFMLGRFATAAEAARAYDRKAVELHGEFAVLNFEHERRSHMIALGLIPDEGLELAQLVMRNYRPPRDGRDASNT